MSSQRKDIFVGVDIGGSHLSVGFVDSKGCLLSESDVFINNREITPKEIIKLIVQTIDRKGEFKHRINAVGVGCPGQSVSGTIIATANFPFFSNTPIASMLSRKLGDIPVKLMNDADAALAAEVWSNDTASHYRSYRNIVLLTLGTGIGMGLMIEKQIYHGSNGLIEGGHMLADGPHSTELCGCGQKGCVEIFASAKNTALQLKRRDLAQETPPIGSPISGGRSLLLAENAKDVFDRFSAGDSTAIEIVEQTAEYLAVLCVNICRIVDPEVIVFGGGMSRVGNTLLNLVQKHIRAKAWKVLPTDVRLFTAYSGPSAGVIGAAMGAKFAHPEAIDSKDKMPNAFDVAAAVGDRSDSPAAGILISCSWRKPLLVALATASIAMLLAKRYSDRDRDNSLAGQAVAQYAMYAQLLSQIGVAALAITAF